MCILHAGDISKPFNEDQLQLVGHIDVLLVPIGGRYTAGPQEAQEIIQQLKPKIVVPMHYFNNSYTLQRFLDGPYRARLLETNAFSVSSDSLPPETQVIVPQVIWHGRDDDM
jgi:L-ascorbate metabolism protein UlaG (beta-lactamase superfamily)